MKTLLIVFTLGLALWNAWDIAVLQTRLDERTKYLMFLVSEARSPYPETETPPKTREGGWKVPDPVESLDELLERSTQ